MILNGDRPAQGGRKLVGAISGGVSVLAIAVAMVAAHPAPVMACPSSTTSNVAAASSCTGPFTPTSGTFTNNGIIKNAPLGVEINASVSISSLSNSGILSASSGAIYVTNGGTIGSLTNSGSITGSGQSWAQGIRDQGVIQTLTNTTGHSIYGDSNGFYINAGGSIGTLTNSGSIGGGQNAIALNGPASGFSYIGTLTNNNDGTISGSVNGIYNGSNNSQQGSIGVISNLCIITGTSGYAIDNTNGTIDKLINGQGGGGTIGTGTLGALTYTGNLPGIYFEYITSSSHYGQLNYTGSDTLGTFGIASNSLLANGTYASVLTGIGTVGSVSSTNGTLSGSVGSGNWVLEDMGDDVWDLILSGIINGPDAANTRTELGYSRDQLLSALRAHAAVTTNAMGYDCATFDKNGVCIAFNARYSSLDSVNDGGGVLTGAYRLSDTTRIGAFIDYAVSKNLHGIKFGDDLPTVGGFLAYTQKPDGTGVQARLAASYNTGKATLTRDDTLDATEPGSGKANLTTYAIGGELGYGFALARDVLATPYAGLRYTAATRSAYSETTGEAVTDPISYASYGQRLTTATLGLRFNGTVTDKLSVQIGLGGEYDLSSVANAFSGTSSISGLESFAIANSARANRLRGNGALGLAYALAPNQKFTTSVSVRGEAYTTKPSTNVLIGYQVGF